MSIKRILILFLTISIVFSLLLSTYISNKYMVDYFSEYIDEQYEINSENIKEYAKYVLTQGYKQRGILNSYIKDPIYYAEIYDANDNLITNSGMQSGNFVFDEEKMIVNVIEITDDKTYVGKALITREINTSNTITNKLFSKALLMGGLISFLAAIVLISLLLIFAIKSIGKSVNDVVNFATHDDVPARKYKVSEFNTIVAAIKQYRVKLSLKQLVKKEKLDKLLHETKTPITIIKSQLEGISDGIIKPDSLRITSMVDELNNLNYVLKDITGIFDGSQTIDDIILENMDYSDEMDKIVKSFSPKFAKKNIELIYNKTPLFIKTNKQLLNQAIYNIIINCYKYTDHGSVTISTDDQKKTIKIRDTGIGIDSQDLKSIGNPYFRGQNIGNQKGEGLGISNTLDNILKLKATMSINSNINEYTEVEISFTK